MKKGRHDSTRNTVYRRLVLHRLIDERGCWIWTGATMKNGYGVIGVYVNGKQSNRLVHRASAWVFNGFNPSSELQIMHKCDVKNCFNPEHLSVGTQLDNIRDMWNKGRGPNQRHPRKLTAADVTEMRSMYEEGHHTTRQLAQMFGIGKSAVSSIIRKKIWSHV